MSQWMSCDIGFIFLSFVTWLGGNSLELGLAF